MAGENLNWTKRYELILFDHHSDATAVFNSDFIRKTLADSQSSEAKAAFTIMEEERNNTML